MNMIWWRKLLKTIFDYPAYYEVRCRHCGQPNGMWVDDVSMSGYICSICRGETKNHNYVSTACFHHLHALCRHTCKFCHSGCKCPCHITPAIGMAEKMEFR